MLEFPEFHVSALGHMPRNEVRDEVRARLRTVVPGKLLPVFDQIVIPPLDQRPPQSIELGVDKKRKWSFLAGYLGARLTVAHQKGTLSLEEAISLEKELFPKELTSKFNLLSYPYTQSKIVQKAISSNIFHKGEVRHWSYGLEELEAKLRGLN